MKSSLDKSRPPARIAGTVMPATEKRLAVGIKTMMNDTTTDFDPMTEPWDGTTNYGAEPAKTDWEAAIAYAVPVAAQVIREAALGPETLPPDARTALVSEALALAALSTWTDTLETATMIAKPNDITARIMVGAAVMMSGTPAVGKAETGVWVTTNHSPAYMVPDAVYVGQLLAEAADALPNSVTLETVARLLDDRAPGVGQWTAALAVITPKVKAA